MLAERREKATYAQANVLLFYFIFYSVVTINSQVLKKNLKYVIIWDTLVELKGKML